MSGPPHVTGRAHPEVGEDVPTLHVLSPQSDLPVRVSLVLHGSQSQYISLRASHAQGRTTERKGVRLGVARTLWRSAKLHSKTRPFSPSEAICMGRQR